MPGLRIGIDARAAAEVPAGRGRLVRELLQELARDPRGHEWLLYAREPWDGAPGLDWRLCGARDPAWHLRTARAASRECDVFYSTNSYLTTWFTRVPTATMVADMVAFLPEMAPQRRASLIERATLRLAVARCRKLLCISDSTRDDLVERYPGAAAKAVTVLLGVSEELGREPPAEELAEVRARLELPERFVLATGTLEPRKNLPRLAEAHARLPAELRAAHPLILTGPPGWELDRALAGVRERGSEVRLLGYVGEADLRALYRLCTVFAYPSLYEGFGLPLLEAMRCGAACVTSSISSLPEVGGDAVAYADPLDTGSIAVALERLLSDPPAREELGRAAQARAATFTWARTADETVALLESCAG